MATIETHITKVENEVGSEWFTILTDNDEVRKLATKRSEIAAEAAELRKSGALATVEYTERTKHDPATGRTYRNFYLDRAAPAAPAPSSETGIDQVAPAGRKLDPSEAWRICLATGAKLAVETMALMPEGQRTFEMQKQIAEAWAGYIYYTPIKDPMQAAMATASSPEPSYNPDDDIPF